jgi:hypothetical protein
MAKRKPKDKRQKLIDSFVSKKADPTVVYGDKFGDIGGSAGDRIRRGGSGKITEDDPRWNPKTMGNKRGRRKGFTRQY